MVYKRYIKKKVDGELKTFGPYYYESYRDEKGKTHSRYLPDYDSKRAVTEKINNHAVKQKHTLAFVLILAIVGIIVAVAILNYEINQNSESALGDSGFSFKSFTKGVYGFFTGYTTEEDSDAADTSSSSTDSSSSDASEVVEDQSTSQETTEQPIETPVDQETSETETQEEIIEIPETPEETIEKNDSTSETTVEIPIEQETQENKTLDSQNQTINEVEESSDSTQIQNITNKTIILENETFVEVNITNETSIQDNVTTQISLKQYGAVLGNPVRWEKKVKVIDSEGVGASNLNIKIPKNAGNVSVKKKTNSGEKDVDAFIENVKTIEEIESEKKQEKTDSNVFDSVFNFVLGFFRGMTGRVIEEEGNKMSVEIQEQVNNNEEIVVEYYTEAPYSEENVINNDTKEITIIGPDELHYEGVLAFTYLEEETVPDAIKLYHLVGDSNEIVEVNALDINNNKLIDYIEWVVPSLSTQEYKLEIQRGEKKRVIIKMQNKNSMDEYSAFGKKEKQFATEKNEIEVRELDFSMIEYLNSNEFIEIVEDQPVDLLVEESEQIIRSIDVKSEFGLTGNGQKICIIDTGVDSSVVDYLLGFDFVNNDSDASDDNGHGTQVAYIAKTIALNAEILVAKVLSANGTGYESNVLEGVQWCIDNNANIISFSIGAGSYSGFCDVNIVAELVNTAVLHGIFVVAATGNDNSLNLKSPSCASNVTRVSATTKYDKIADFANLNELVDLFAPGENINTKTIGGEDTTKSGTSMSTPMVSAGAALLLENETLTPDELKYRFRSTGKPITYALDLLTLINISRIDVYNAIINNLTMIPYAYSGNQSEGNETPYEFLGTGCADDPLQICNNGNACCNLGFTACATAQGSKLTNYWCYDCDDGAISCAKCCNSTGSAGNVCSSAYYGALTWMTSDAACCGDDGAADDLSSGSSATGCCCDGSQIGTGDDVSCSGNSNYWCIDGTYCTGGSGLVRDTSLTATGTTYTISSDTVVCGCDSSGSKCDDNDADATVDGLCASSQCVSDMVAWDAASNYTNASCYLGFECDNSVGTTTARYSRTGWCISSSCCYGAVAISGELSGTTPNWAAGDEVCGPGGTSCTAVTNNQICDDTPNSGPTAVGVCTDVSGTHTCIGGLKVACNTTDINCLNGGYVFYACAAGRSCDSVVTGTNGYQKDGYCAGSSCCTGAMNSGEYSQTAEDWAAGDESCTCASHYICDDAVAIGSPSATGVCVSTICDTSLVGCDVTNADCNPPAGTLYTTCSSTGALRYCDSAVGTNGYERNGVCGNTGCCTGAISSGESSGTAEDWTGGDESCTCSNNMICDSGGLSSSDPNADGVCAGTTCDVNTVACSNTDANCAGGTIYTACATGRQGCDSDVVGNGFERNGHCGAASCCTSTISSGEISSPDWTAGDESCTCSNTGFICDTTAISGPTAGGVCAEGASNACQTSGAVANDSDAYIHQDKILASLEGVPCDSDITAPGVGYVRDGYSCIDGAGIFCIVDGARTVGQSCCVDENCDAGLPCSGGICAASDQPPEIVLVSPVPYYNATSFSITFNVSVTDDVNLTNVSLWGNWSGGWHLNVTNSSGMNNTYYIFTLDFTDDGEDYYVWGITAMDNISQQGNSSNRTFTISISAPKWFDNSTNSTLKGRAIAHKVRWTDYSLKGYIFSFDNGTGTFVNDSWASMTGAENWSNVTKVVNSTYGSTIRWIVYANDSLNKWNLTSTFSYITTNTAPTDPTPILVSVDSSNSSLSDLNCSSVIIDVDDTKLNVSVNWFKNGALNFTADYNNSYATTTLFSAILNSSNLSSGDVWICGMRVYDGIDYSNWVNSSGVTIVFPTVDLDLIYPIGNINVSQNEFFNVTLNVTCRTGDCGTINVSLFGNYSLVNTTEGAVPFYTNATQNPNTTMSLIRNQSQLMNFWLNATGEVDSIFDFFAYLNMTLNTSISNITESWNVTIIQPIAIAIDLSDKLTSQINWTLLSLPVYNQSAEGNNGTEVSEYYVNISVTGGTADLYVKANDNLMTSGGDVLLLGNETYSYNSTNSSVPSIDKYPLTTNYIDNKIGDSLTDGIVVYLKFFLNAPSNQAPGDYNNTLYFKAVSHGASP